MCFKKGRNIKRRWLILAGFCVSIFLATCFLHPKIVFSREFSPSDPPVLHIGKYALKAHADKRTVPSLCLKPEGGTQTYYVDLYQDNGYAHGLRLKHNGVTYSAGRFELFYEASVFNSCQTVSLPKGFYCVDLLGGRGGAGGNNSGSGLVSTDVKHECFELNETTSVSVFRGGDGNNGSVNSNGSVRSGGGGGASGVPSLFAVGNTVLVSKGGAGGVGGAARDYNGDNKNCGAGGGGNASAGGAGSDGLVNYALNNTFLICGGGGGGAVSGTGGASAERTVLFFSYTADAGSNAGSSAGGAGGAAHRSTSQKSGGSGGNNTTYTCAGTSLVSYGGGGGGAVCTRASSYVDLNGGNGGSGSTGTSSSSYVRIYRFE